MVTSGPLAVQVCQGTFFIAAASLFETSQSTCRCEKANGPVKFIS